MVFRQYLLLLLLAHVIGDFYLFPEKLDGRKGASAKWVVLHCLGYFTTCIVVSLPLASWNAVFYGTLAALTHALIESAEYSYALRLKRKANITCQKEQNIFILNQVLQIASLVIIAYFFGIRVENLHVRNSISDFFAAAGISKMMFISWITAVLIIHKPANALISKILMIYKPAEKNSGRKNDNNVGRFIGTVERVIMLMLISIGQYSAIGLVLTAKSIARYDKIVKKPEFAEYYLLGTLLSTAVVIVISVIV